MVSGGGSQTVPSARNAVHNCVLWHALTPEAFARVAWSRRSRRVAARVDSSVRRSICSNALAMQSGPPLFHAQGNPLKPLCTGMSMG
jgi:hypothetical protein